MFLGPVWSYLLPVPLVIQIVGVTREESQSSGVRVNRQTLVEVPVVDLLGLAVVRPRALHHAHLAPGNTHPVRTLRLDTPFSVG